MQASELRDVLSDKKQYVFLTNKQIFLYNEKIIIMNIELILITFVVLQTVLVFWALIDILSRFYKKEKIELYWIFVVLLFPFLGSVIYFHAKHREKMNQSIFKKAM